MRGSRECDLDEGWESGDSRGGQVGGRLGLGQHVRSPLLSFLSLPDQSSPGITEMILPPPGTSTPPRLCDGADAVAVRRGGTKSSGVGRENGKEAFRAYSQTKSTIINYAPEEECKRMDE